MSKVLTDNANYTAIANAIREKNGSTDTYKPADMAAAIAAITTSGGEGGYDIPDEAFVISGDSEYQFYKGNWDWFIDEYKDKITTKDITTAGSMFYGSEVKEIPFDFNFISGVNCDTEKMFQYSKATKIGDFINLRAYNFQYLFAYCYYLKELPRLINLDKTQMEGATRFYLSNIFMGCYSLRKIPEEYLLLDNPNVSTYTQKITCGFQGCNSLDEINGLYPTAATMTSNMLNTFSNCYRLKELTFKLDENGNPFIRNWKGQSLSLINSIGYTATPNSITDYSEYNGITIDKMVNSSETYEALKNDDDWFSTRLEYSRYNHTSAVNTINSLPDTSAYLETAGGTNNIKFNGNLGSETDGGAINTLTEEEIAVATAKGWTVSFS